MDEKLERLRLLLDDKQINNIINSKVLVIGIGGVGGYVCEALVRCGIKEISIMDHDTVSLSNFNRQIIATKSNLGLSKVIAMKNRIEDISDCTVNTYDMFYNNETNIIDNSYDYVIDCCDTISAKIDIIKKCHDLNVKSITCTGTGNRIDPNAFIYTTLDKTTYDPVSKAMRQIVKKQGIKYKIKVICSKEQPTKQNKVINKDGKTMKDKYPIASNSYVPSSAGLFIASIVIKQLINKDNI